MAALLHQQILQLILFHQSFPPLLGLLALLMIGGLLYLALETLLTNPVTDDKWNSINHTQYYNISATYINEKRKNKTYISRKWSKAILYTHIYLLQPNHISNGNESEKQFDTYAYMLISSDYTPNIYNTIGVWGGSDSRLVYLLRLALDLLPEPTVGVFEPIEALEDLADEDLVEVGVFDSAESLLPDILQERQTLWGKEIEYGCSGISIFNSTLLRRQAAWRNGAQISNLRSHIWFITAYNNTKLTLYIRGKEIVQIWSQQFLTIASFFFLHWGYVQSLFLWQYFVFNQL